MQDDFVSTEEPALWGKPKSERKVKKDDFLVVGKKIWMWKIDQGRNC